MVKYAPLNNQHLVVDPQDIYFVTVSSDVTCLSFAGFYTVSVFDYFGQILRDVMMIGNDVCYVAMVMQVLDVLHTNL